MIKDALQYLRELTSSALDPKQVIIDGRTYCDRDLKPMRPSQPHVVKVQTLQGLVDLVKSGIGNFDPGDAVIHVVGPTDVRVYELSVNEWGERETYTVAEMSDPQPFAFGRFMDPESFVIGLQSKFLVTPDLEVVLRQVCGLTSEAVTTSNDDGVTQVVGTRKGVVLQQKESIRSRVMLAPYRTFREIEQPASAFLFRVKTLQEGIPPACALFEADGGAWQIEAVTKIKTWLDSQGVGVNVVA